MKPIDMIFTPAGKSEKYDKTTVLRLVEYLLNEGYVDAVKEILKEVNAK